MPTPPPPLWGTLLEEENYDPKEEFYNHEKALIELRRRKSEALKKSFINPESTPRSKRLKLKKKVIYTYEYSDDSGSDKEKEKV